MKFDGYRMNKETMKEKGKNPADAGFRPPEKNTLAFDPEQGKIYKFNLNRIEVVRLGKPYPAAYLKTASSKSWENQIPSVKFPFIFYKPNPQNLKSENEAVRKYVGYKQDIYDSIVDYVGEDRVRLLEKYNQRSWFLYCLLVHGGDYASDLMRTNPSLAWLLSAHGVFHTLKSRRYWRSVRALLRKKRREILGYFGFPASEAAVKLMSRMAPGSCNNELFFILRKNLAESPELIRQLSFYPCHNASSLRIICSKLRPYFGYHALSEIGALDPQGGEDAFNRKIRDIMYMRATLERYGIRQPPFYIRKLSDIDTVHDDMVMEMNWAIRVHDQQYGEAPVPDIKRDSVWIENIRWASDLHQEGRDMHHCIFSYHERLNRGCYYIARMFIPERLTILYQSGYNKQQGEAELQLVEARGSCNEDPQERSLYIIRQWLKQVDLSYYDPDQLTIFDEHELDDLRTESG